MCSKKAFFEAARPRVAHHVTRPQPGIDKHGQATTAIISVNLNKPPKDGGFNTVAHDVAIITVIAKNKGTVVVLIETTT